MVVSSRKQVSLSLRTCLRVPGLSADWSCACKAAVDKTVQGLQNQGIKAAGIAAHVGDRKQLEALVQFAVDTFGGIDILVSNAAVNPAAGPIMDMPDAVIDKVLAINIKAAIQLAQLARPHLKRVRAVCFSTLGAAASLTPVHCPGEQHRVHLLLHGLRASGADRPVRREQDCPPGPHQGAGRGAGARRHPRELHRTRYACLAGGASLIKQAHDTSCMHAGTVPTKFASALVEDPKAEEASIARTFLGRLGTPADIAAGVAYLVSPDAAYVTGETLMITGGMQARL